MNNNFMTIHVWIFVTIFVHKSLHYVNSQSIPYTIEIFNNTTTNNSLNLVEIDTTQNTDNCSKAFEVFAEKFTNLTRCTLVNARPIHICMDCQEEMNAAKETYDKLLEELSCKQYYLESDQIGIVDVIFNQVSTLWSSNNCQNCYNHPKETEEFFETSRELDKCMKQYNESQTDDNNTCIMCLEYFANLNDIYKSFVMNITVEDNSGICMDILDQMNITRHAWNNLGCLILNSYIGFPIILTAVIVGIIPVLFYLLSKNVSIIEDVKLVRPKRKSYASLQDSLPKE